MSTISSNARLPFGTKLSYGLGTVAFGIKDHGFNALLMLYYNQVIGLPATWVGTAIMVAMLIDAVADPVIGHLSDHWRSRWGRRHPFMYASAIPIAVAYFLLWSPPHASQEIQFLYLLITSVAVRVAISCYEIPSAALISEFTDQYDERTSLSTFRSLFLAIGMVVMSVVTFKIILQPSAEQPIAQLNPEGYTHYGVIAATVMLLCVLLSTLGTHSRIPYLKAPADGAHASLKGLLADMKLLMLDRVYASVLLCCLFFAIATGISTTLGSYISTYYWRLNAEHIGSIAGAAALGLILALLAVHLSKRFGKKQTAVVLYSIALVACTLPVTLGLMGIMPREISALLPYLVIQNAFVVMCVLAALIVAMSMIADVADHLELKTGKRMEGTMFAAMIMINKGVSGFGVFLSGLLLSAINFPEKATPGAVDPAIVDQLAVWFVLVMGVFVSLAIVALSFYSITRESHEKTLLELREARG